MGRTPFELWTGKTPDVSHLREFGSNVYCLDRVPGKGKFEERTKKGVFLGYATNSKGYRVWLPDEGKVEVTRDLRFLQGREDPPTIGEGIAPQDTAAPQEDSLDIPDEVAEIELKPTENNPDVLQEDDVREDPDHDAGVEETPRRGPGRPRILRTGARGRPRKIFSAPREAANVADDESSYLAEVPIKKVTSGPEADEWYRAMAEETASILKNNTWELVERPDDHEVIGSRMVLRNKYKPDGTLERRHDW